ncbi:MAG: tRNA 2-selenouridine(34) synthase MnmH [Planctomycetota bacterium]
MSPGPPSVPAGTLVPTVSVERALAAPDRVVVDLRSPAEFAADHVPGAVNVPLFDDVERAVIGTLYRQSSPAAAFAAGWERTREKIGSLAREVAAAAGWEPPAADLPGLVDRMCAGGIEALDGELAVAPAERLGPRPVILLCWRGGLRSRSVVALLRRLGLARAVCLAGGYRAYRRHVCTTLDTWQAPAAFVLRGLTGVGKTLVLREVERRVPGATLDLEAIAGHRSSILGMVGLKPATQKGFDSSLAARLEAGFPGWMVVEGESRKVGDVILPPAVWGAVSGGAAIELVAPPSRRVDVLVEDYLARAENRAELAARLPFLEERLGRRKWAGVLGGLLAAGRERELVALLLEHYYDPLYRHSEGVRAYATTIDATDPAAAAARVVAWVDAHQAIRRP